MPLVGKKKAKTKKGFGENVKREMQAGKPQKQAVAIAYSQAGEKKLPKRGQRAAKSKSKGKAKCHY